MRNNRLYLFVFVFAAALSGCGYRTSLLIPADVHSVSVQIPQNDSFWRKAEKVDNLPQDAAESAVEPAQRIEVDLAERLKREVVRLTPLRIADESSADSILKTTIKELDPRVLVRDPNDEVIAQRVTIKVDFEWVDRRTGRVIASGKGVSRPTDFNVARGETLTNAARKSMDYISIEIVERMREGF